MTIFRANVQGGTGAGSKSRPDKTVTHCDCGGFISQDRAQSGATRCKLCTPKGNYDIAKLAAALATGKDAMRAAMREARTDAAA